MPAAYAHITMVNAVALPKYLDAIPAFPLETKQAVMQQIKFCELGAMSPDYPYLALTLSPDQAHWADLMHYVNTVGMIRAGISQVARLTGEPRLKGLAWLLGYAAHVAADVTVHPVVRLRVGDYEEHKTAHRTCEMHEDVYIFARRMHLQVTLAEFLQGGIGGCGCQGDPNRLDPTIEALWDSMLAESYPAEHAQGAPRFGLWRRGFDLIMEGCSGSTMVCLARHVAPNCGLAYPATDALDSTYLHALQVPGGVLEYEAVFEKALQSISYLWGQVAQGVITGNLGTLATATTWNLDTGQDESNRLVFWS
ncbi:MAG TPA: zinc dependent phospholipase C family protein [archaeon]|nr:zinc dependent phospholipase C family protein [archaeon]